MTEPDGSRSVAVTPDAAVVDLDGTVVEGGRVIEGAASGIRSLRSVDVPVVFLTNRATESPAEHASVLRSGDIVAEADDVLTAAQITADAMEPSDSPALVVGSEYLCDRLRAAGIELTGDPDAAATVVASVDTDLDFATLTAATRALAAGCRFVATNPDGVRSSPAGPVPETGAVVAALSVAADRSPTVLGKPAARAARAAARRVDADPADCLFVGDNPETDIELGRRVGATTVLVGRDCASSSRPTDADYTIDSLADIDSVVRPTR